MYSFNGCGAVGSLLHNSSFFSLRLVTRAKKHDHVSPILCQLHWLPIRYRIQFKILSLVFLCINDLAPSYLQELLVQYRPSRNLRSQSKSLLVSPRINTQFYGARSFQSSAPELWNNIPDKIKLRQQLLISLKLPLKLTILCWIIEWYNFVDD